MQLLHHLADPSGDLIAHIGHLHTSLLLHHHLNDDLQLQFAVLAIHQLVLSWHHYQPESHQQSLNQSSCSDRQTETETHRPDPRDTWVR